MEMCEQAYRRKDSTSMDSSGDRTVDLYLKLGTLSRWGVPLVTIIVCDFVEIDLFDLP